MAGLPYEERIKVHHGTKPFSIDPFNEVGMPEKERDALLIRDFLAAYEALSSNIADRISGRYYRMGHEFGR
jgi:hypothetical protein